MIEQVPKTQNDLSQAEMLGDVNAALAASEARGAMRTVELGGSNPQTTTLESAGDVTFGPFVQKATDREGSSGEVVDVNFNSLADKSHGNATSLFEANTRGITDSQTGERVHAKVTRTDSTGNVYQHEFHRPETAQRFGALIARQVVRRTEDPAAQNRIAA